MVEYASAAGTPLLGAYSAAQTPNWTKGNGRKRRGGDRSERETRGEWETGTGYRREERKGKGGREGEERGGPQLQLLHPPVFAKQFHTVKAGGHRVRGCLSFACSEIFGWMIPQNSNVVSVDGRTEEGRGPRNYM